MEPRRLTPALSVAAQIDPDDVPEIVRLGFKAIINNRPDNESPSQPASTEIAEAAKRTGLAYRYIPVRSGMVTDENVGDFAEALGELEGPVLAFCRSGTRCTVLWALSEAGHTEPSEIVRIAADAGYDMAPLLPRIVARAGGS